MQMSHLLNAPCSIDVFIFLHQLVDMTDLYYVAERCQRGSQLQLCAPDELEAVLQRI